MMGEIVKAELLRPVDDYAKVYGWEDRYSPTLLDLNKFSADGSRVRLRRAVRALADGRDRRRLLQQGRRSRRRRRR